jgi:F0F1-type ATP synthase membrane subunit b/b'
MQSEVINDILAVEDRAERIVADANQTARDILASADAQASEMIRNAVEAEREQGRQAIADAEASVSEAVQSYEDQLKEDYSADSMLAQVDVESVADRIVEKVCSTMLHGKGGLRT